MSVLAVLLSLPCICLCVCLVVRPLRVVCRPHNPILCPSGGHMHSFCFSVAVAMIYDWLGSCVVRYNTGIGDPCRPVELLLPQPNELRSRQRFSSVPAQSAARSRGTRFESDCVLHCLGAPSQTNKQTSNLPPRKIAQSVHSPNPSMCVFNTDSQVHQASTI